MTLCAAAIASESYIVAISDTMITGSTISSDGCSVKMEPFARDWLAMLSADDITQCLPIVQLAAKYLHNRANTAANARAAFKRAYQQHMVQMRTDAVLSPYGMNMDGFLKSGKRRFTEKLYTSLCERMEQIKAGCSFLIFGFDGTGRAHIFTIEEPGTDRTYDKPGFCCIGSGMYAADAMLHYFGQAVYKNLSETVFNLCAAKFMAERSGIGKDTYLYVKQPRTVASSHRFGLIQDIREEWDKNGAPRVPPSALARIAGADIRCIGADLK